MSKMLFMVGNGSISTHICNSEYHIWQKLIIYAISDVGIQVDISLEVYSTCFDVDMTNRR